MKPVEESVYWIEYVLKHGNALQPASAQMPLYQLLLLDVWAAIATAFLIITFAIKKIFSYTLFVLTNGKQKKLKRQ